MRYIPVSLIALVVSLLMVCGGAVRADTTPVADSQEAVQVARAHYIMGEKAYQAGDFAAAREEFLKAYEYAPRPALLYNLAQVAMRQGQREMARGYLRDYLQTQPSDAEQIRREISRLDEEPPPAASPAVIPASPPAPAPPAPRPLPSAREGAGRVAAPLLLAIGGAGLVAGISVLAAGAAASPDAGDADSQQRARSMVVSGAYVGALGVAAVIGGATLYLLHRRGEAPGRQVRVLPAGPGIQVVGRF